MGDIECTAPLDELARPLLDRGIAVHWISGNHDNDGGREMWDNLTDPVRNPITSGGALHGRVVDIAGVRVAGLSGIFRPRVWDSRRMPSLRRRADLAADLAKLGPALRVEHVDALIHSLSTIAIWHEDVEALAKLHADVLVVHDAPCSHRDGHAVLTDLARRMGARAVLHGHHHVSYVAENVADDLRAVGVGASWVWTSPGACCGVASRHASSARRPRTGGCSWSTRKVALEVANYSHYQGSPSVGMW